MSLGGGDLGGGNGTQGQGIAAALTAISERAMQLVHEEIELAKVEISEKLSRLLKGGVVALAAGVFVLGALIFVMIGLALLAWYLLPVGELEVFWGFFLMAAILLVLAVLAGVIAARAVKSGSPPVPTMAIEEARKIREAVSASPDGSNVLDDAERSGAELEGVATGQPSAGDAEGHE